jgi:hypothetical protein
VEPSPKRATDKRLAPVTISVVRISMALNWLLLAMGDTWLGRDVMVALPVA